MEALENFLYEMYLNLMEAGHSMTDIDNIDIVFYLKMLNHKQEKENKKQQSAAICSNFGQDCTAGLG